MVINPFEEVIDRTREVVDASYRHLPKDHS